MIFLYITIYKLILLSTVRPPEQGFNHPLGVFPQPWEVPGMFFFRTIFSIDFGITFFGHFDPKMVAKWNQNDPKCRSKGRPRNDLPNPSTLRSRFSQTLWKGRVYPPPLPPSHGPPSQPAGKNNVKTHKKQPKLA